MTTQLKDKAALAADGQLQNRPGCRLGASPGSGPRSGGCFLRAAPSERVGSWQSPITVYVMWGFWSGYAWAPTGAIYVTSSRVCKPCS